jgi:diguanylate cyclase (GGDEF)-like protein
MSASWDKSVLVVDDSAVYRRLIASHLEKWGFRVTVAASGLEGWEILKRHDSPALVVSDWMMPEMDGLELCRRVREGRSADSYVYVILLTSREGHTDLISALEAGADDYLVKPFDEEELKARLLVGKRIVDLQQELVVAKETMRHAATHDGLTGLLNRREGVDMMRLELARSCRERTPLTVIMADIDHFKKVNDTLGHIAGDEVLVEMGRRLRSQVRPYDLVARYGGEEFLLVMPACDLTSALIRADQIRSFVASRPFSTSVRPQMITLSMGVTVVDGKTEPQLQTVLQLVDMGLYKAKREGRNRVEHIDPENASETYLLSPENSMSG